MSRTPFDERAARYEDWYATATGRLASECERALLGDVLSSFPEARTVVEIGCGTGHFTRWLRERGLEIFGVDRSPGMLAALRRRSPDLPVVLADAHALPMARSSVDLCLFVTTLEFLHDPRLALTEAAGAARRGVIALVLNRWSAGGLSRRLGPQRRRPILGHARDLSLWKLRRLLLDAAGPHTASVLWSSTLFPPPLRRLRARVPFGDVLAVAARFDDQSYDSVGRPDVRI